MTDGIHSYVTLEKNLRITPRELEESGKILGKDLWVRAHSKDTPLERIVEKIDDAPEQLKYLNEVTTSN